MDQKLLHTSPDLLIHPGETIAEILEDREISQKELSIRTGFTEKHISTVINGKKSISAKLALNLEHALDIPSSFWKNLQSNYDLEVESFNEINNISKNEIAIAKEIIKPVEVITGKELNTSNDSFGVWNLRKLLGVSNLETIEKLNTGFYRGQFSVDTNKYIMYVFQYLSEKECENQTQKSLDIELLGSKLNEIKSIMLSEPLTHISSIKKVLNECGVLFTVKKHVKKAPINGLTVKTKNNRVMIAMTIRNKYVDTFWFSLFHEIAHVLNKDFLIEQNDFSKSVDIEQAADEFARNVLISSSEYEKFIENRNFSESEIVKFAEKINVLPSIIVGRLMKDGLIPWKQNSLRVKYEWVDQMD